MGLAEQEECHACRGGREQLLVEKIEQMVEREYGVLCKKAALAKQRKEIAPAHPARVGFVANAAKFQEKRGAQWNAAKSCQGDYRVFPERGFFSLFAIGPVREEEQGRSQYGESRVQSQQQP